MTLDLPAIRAWTRRQLATRRAYYENPSVAGKAGWRSRRCDCGEPTESYSGVCRTCQRKAKK